MNIIRKIEKRNVRGEKRAIYTFIEKKGVDAKIMV
jgi:hypothetical protein